MRVTINGQEQDVAAGSTLQRLLEAMKVEPRAVAVEVNLQVIPRARHAECQLQPGDRLEIVTLVGGG